MAVALTLTGCATEDDSAEREATVPTISAHFTFSLPKRIVGTPSAGTRMTPFVVQYDEDAASFRGITGVRLFCYEGYPTANSDKTGDIIVMNALANDAVDASSEYDYTVNRDLQIPLGTSHFSFYGRAADQPQTHEERMRYGIVETVGLNRYDYSGNSGIRFRPVPICTSTDIMGGSQHGQALLHLLNDLLNTVGPEPAPDDLWPTTQNTTLQEAYQCLSELRTSSSFNVQVILGTIYQMLARVAAGEAGHELCALLMQKIKDNCQGEPDAIKGTLVLKDDFQGYPDDIHLPAGAARIVWNASQNRFEFPDVQAYGKALDIPSLNDYCYPMNLQYHIVSPIVVSDSLVLIDKNITVKPNEADDPTGANNNPNDPTGADNNNNTVERYKTWRQIVDSLYPNAATSVQPTTRSVAMVEQLQYAVGRLDLRAKIADGKLYDAKGREVDASKGYTLKGYIVGGQREVDYNFTTVEGSHEYTIYSTDINGGTQHLAQGSWTPKDHILGLGTVSDKPVYLAMELVNNGDAFQGADGVIPAGGTFYLVAGMVPSEGVNYASGFLDQIFRKDFVTEVSMTVNNGWPDKDADGVPDPDLDEHGNPKPLTGLATATYGLPDIQQPRFEFGLSVNLGWGEGITFEHEF